MIGYVWTVPASKSAERESPEARTAVDEPTLRRCSQCGTGSACSRTPSFPFSKFPHAV